MNGEHHGQESGACMTQWLDDVLQAGEDVHHEFKSEAARPFGDRDVYEEVVALANSGGGVLLLGVEDNSEVTGSRPRHGSVTDANRLSAAIMNNTIPAATVTVSVVPIRGHDVVAVMVSACNGICATRAGKTIRRQIGPDGKPETVPYYPIDHGLFHTGAGGADYSAHTVEGLSFEDLDPLEFQRMRRLVSSLRGDSALTELSDRELAQALRLVETREGQLIPNVAGLLLLGTPGAIETYLPTHEVYFQAFDVAGGVRVNEQHKGPILAVVEAMEQRFSARNQETEVEVGLIRLPVPDYAPESLREGFNNALLHRDYSRLGGIYIQWYPDHILIASPGPFPPGVTVENILIHEPKPRNPRLAEAFRRIGLVEQTGRGVDRIYLGQLRYGRPAPDYSRSDSEGVRVVLPGGQPSLQFAALVYEENRVGRILSLDELMVLNTLFYERQTDSVAAGSLIQKGSSAARAVLEGLVERGLLEARGERRGRVYMLSAALYGRLHQEVEYVRARGFEPLQREQMVLNYVRNHGEIARSEAAELCQLTPRQAGRLLADMIGKYPEFEMTGSRRWARYVIRED
jgi:ATP-dependent DNA helicase RecG